MSTSRQRVSALQIISVHKMHGNNLRKALIPLWWGVSPDRAYPSPRQALPIPLTRHRPSRFSLEGGDRLLRMVATPIFPRRPAGGISPGRFSGTPATRQQIAKHAGSLNDLPHRAARNTQRRWSAAWAGRIDRGLFSIYSEMDMRILHAVHACSIKAACRRVADPGAPAPCRRPGSPGFVLPIQQKEERA